MKYNDWKEKQDEHLRRLRNIGRGVDHNSNVVCKHLLCPSCLGTGVNKLGQPCIHMISCRCPRCSPYSSAPLSDKPIGMDSCCDRTPPEIVFGEAKLSNNPDDLSWR